MGVLYNRPVRDIAFTLEPSDSARLVAENDLLRARLAQAALDLAALYRVYHAAEYIRRPGEVLHAALNGAREHLGMPSRQRTTKADFKRMTVAFMAGAVEAGIPLYSVLKRLGVGMEVAYNWRADVNAGRMLSDSSRTNMPAQDSYLNSLLDAASTADHDTKVSARLDYRATRKGERKLKEEKMRLSASGPTPDALPTRPGTSDAALDALTPRYQTDEET